MSAFLDLSITDEPGEQESTRRRLPCAAGAV